MKEEVKQKDEEKLDADSSSQIQEESSSVENSDGHTPGMRKLTVNRQPSQQREAEAADKKPTRRPVTAEEHRIEKEKLLKQRLQAQKALLEKQHLMGRGQAYQQSGENRAFVRRLKEQQDDDIMNKTQVRSASLLRDNESIHLQFYSDYDRRNQIMRVQGSKSMLTHLYDTTKQDAQTAFAQRFPNLARSCMTESESTPTKTSNAISSAQEESKMREDVLSGSLCKNFREKLQQAMQQRVPSVYQHTSAF